MLVAAAVAKLVSAVAFGTLGLIGLTNDNVTSIVVAAIGAFGLVASTRHGKRLKRVEDAVHATKDVARESANELAELGQEHNGHTQ